MFDWTLFKKYIASQDITFGVIVQPLFLHEVQEHVGFIRKCNGISCYIAPFFTVPIQSLEIEKSGYYAVLLCAFYIIIV